jgi:hypothetical protein
VGPPEVTARSTDGALTACRRHLHVPHRRVHASWSEIGGFRGGGAKGPWPPPPQDDSKLQTGGGKLVKP